MKNSLVKFILFVLIAMSGCRAAPGGSDVKMWKTYRVDIPHFVVKFSIPPELKPGYGGGFTKEVSFENAGNPRVAFSLGQGTYQKDAGTLFLGVKGDFRDWDLRTIFYIIKFDRSQRSVRSAEELAEFVRIILSEKYLLADGKEVNDLGSITVEKMGSREVVVATNADQYHMQMLKLKGGGEVTIAPYQFYYIRLDDEVTVGIRVFHDNEKKLSPKWHAESHARISKIIENLKVEPKASAAR